MELLTLEQTASVLHVKYARAEYAPRGLIASTGEYTPSLATSRVARLFLVTMEKGDLSIETLSELQRASPAFRRVMVLYLLWLRDGFEEIGKDVLKRFEEIRAELQSMSGLHSRTPENVAYLQIGLEYALAFLRADGAITATEEAYHQERGKETLCALAEKHGRDVQTEQPTQRFLNAIREGLMSGTCWFADRSTDEKCLGYSANGSPKIGWMDQEGIYLIADIAFDFAEKARSGSGGLGLHRQALKNMLKREGYLVEGTASERDRVELKKRVPAGNMRLLVMKRELLSDVEAFEAEAEQTREGEEVLISSKPVRRSRSVPSPFPLSGNAVKTQKRKKRKMLMQCKESLFPVFPVFRRVPSHVCRVVSLQNLHELVRRVCLCKTGNTGGGRLYIPVDEQVGRSQRVGTEWERDWEQWQRFIR
jgi:hypothetical protein